MENNLNPLQKIGCSLINLYQKTLSHIIGNQCRFYPSCSEYTKQAIIIHGFFLGCILGAYRILRCNPLCKGGFDPVPKEIFKTHKQQKK
ncbi:MAG: membrane protein insertion efficiency factor YidD [Ruminobacter sp.]|uniref:membrane protein insertion efficiency factor YidD n=1 Tax=Ruminobacter TaxID=866 RepID=UPI000A016861|nr:MULTISPECIES: membrane protein insertion efficiency factor YidD [Ruminobacter]MBQ3775246.1 membrane protein insertion efficiency factor YidD [Ruminobacter sp.]